MTFVEKKIRAVFNRLDAEPGATQRHSKNLPVSPLRKGGKKTRRRRLSPPCEVLVLRVSAAPMGPKQASPGQRPGDLIRMKIRPALKALKGRNKILDHIPVLFCPLRALLFSTRDPIPRAVPWAGMSLPLRGEIQEAQLQNCDGVVGGGEHSEVLPT